MIKRTCRQSGATFEISKEDLDFYVKMGVITEEQFDKLKSLQVDESTNIEAEKIPQEWLIGLPTLCPEERQRRRTCFRNFTKLYKRNCFATGKPLVSIYDIDKPFPVYENEYWWGDSWDALNFGRDFNFSRSFFEQFGYLQSVVPRFSTYNTNSEKCDYATAFSSKNCYLIGGCVRNEDCAYGHIVWDSNDCFDNLYVSNCQWCSYCIDSVNCYETHFSSECANCSSSYFLHDCRNCEHCFACTNLRNKKYCFMNEQLTEEAYEQKMADITPLSNPTIKNGWQWLEQIKLGKTVFPAMFGLKNEDCTGNHIYESKNCFTAFDAKKSEDSKFLYTSFNLQNSYDISFTGHTARFVLEGLSVHGSEDSKFCFDIHNSNNLLYSSFCFNCEHCFGCTGLRNKKYCILNKQYTPEEYEALVSKIIEHMKKTPLKNEKGEATQGVEWGEFFPANLSPFAYNETVASEYFPLAETEAVKLGYIWKSDESVVSQGKDSYKVPDDIEGISDEILNQVLYCERTGKPYKIQKAELNFYKKMKLPLPILHPDERHKDRMALRNPRRLWERCCADCGATIQTTFAPDRPEKILCEACYLKVVE
ncbi:hypothetical protein CSB37_00575 [bacterium DOLZORAL124_38_8]|nr:MAG: hypothetical protein CSB37_00575 [bacterium DOLZORAL124_38_8]